MKIIIYLVLIIIVAVGCGYCEEKFRLDEAVAWMSDSRDRLIDYEGDLIECLEIPLSRDDGWALSSALGWTRTVRSLVEEISDKYTYIKELQGCCAEPTCAQLVDRIMDDVWYDLYDLLTHSGMIRTASSHIEGPPALAATLRDVLKEVREVQRKLKEI